jgi:hypothetical protein
VSVVIVVASIATARDASAMERCRVEIASADESAGAWVEEASRLDGLLAAATHENDCASVVVQVEEGKARLTFTARDGRRAEREIGEPSELVATVVALGVSVPAPAMSSTTTTSTTTTTTTSTKKTVESKDAVLKPTLIYGGKVGTRYGADNLITPMLEGFVSLLYARWEVGLILRIEGDYTDLSKAGEDTTDHLSAGAVTGVAVSRREPAGPFSLLAGTTLLVAAVSDEKNAPDGGPKGGEVRVGAFLGMVFPRKAKMRYRADAAFELVPHNFGQSQMSASGDPIMPWWAVMLTFSLEFGGP